MIIEGMIKTEAGDHKKSKPISLIEQRRVMVCSTYAVQDPV